jgi:hypothetical protein
VASLNNFLESSMLKPAIVVLLSLWAVTRIQAQEPLLFSHGELTEDDPRLEDESPYDAYTLDLAAGAAVAIEMTSYDVDTFLVLNGPADLSLENDDFGGSTRHSRIELIAQSAGQYEILATCFDPTNRGDYEIRVDPIEGRQASLSEGDATEADGRYIDWYDVECPQGELLMAQINSDAFDTFLVVEDPHQSREENDDFEGSTSISRIETNAFEAGIYRVGVSSFQQGETGGYELMISRAPGYVPTPVEGSQELTAEFDGTEAEGAGIGFLDGYSVQAQKDAIVIVSLNSEAVDTFLKIKGPGGFSESNDDVPGGTNSRLAFRVVDPGTYYITATTFANGEIGSYTIDFDLNASKYEAGDWAVAEGGQVYGVFAGIAEYSDSDALPFCDDDARRVATAFRRNFDMAEDGSKLLMNEDATIAAVESALTDVVNRAGPKDMVVFFYSGHGNRLADDNGDANDPDGIDESLSVYDGDILDDRFSEIFAECKAHTVLVVLDSCFSGGFARDFVSQPGRVGLFSSEGDCLSMTAEELKSGGYLSRFFLDGITNHRDEADGNSDRMLTMHEITFYVQQRFAEALQHQRRGTPSRLFPGGDIDPLENFGFQRVICDRGAISPNLILLDWNPDAEEESPPETE